MEVFDDPFSALSAATLHREKYPQKEINRFFPFAPEKDDSVVRFGLNGIYSHQVHIYVGPISPLDHNSKDLLIVKFFALKKFEELSNPRKRDYLQPNFAGLYSKTNPHTLDEVATEAFENFKKNNGQKIESN
jgi:hypothetical protein